LDGADTDGDGVPDGSDVCPAAADPLQEDADHDGLGDACDDCTDVDGDGASAAAGHTCADDCDDGDLTVFVGAAEVWYDGVDQDCDGNDADQDLDGQAATEAGGEDCDDLEPAAFVGATERWYDGIDQDCDGNDSDQDGDGYVAYEVGGADCDDLDPDVIPGDPGYWPDCTPQAEYNGDDPGDPPADIDTASPDLSLTAGGYEGGCAAKGSLAGLLLLGLLGRRRAQAHPHAAHQRISVLQAVASQCKIGNKCFTPLLFG
jgi:hypothetical protein